MVQADIIYFLGVAFAICLLLNIVGMLGAFHFGRLQRDDPIFVKKSLPPIIDTSEEEEIVLPKAPVGYGEGEYGEEEEDSK